MKGRLAEAQQILVLDCKSDEQQGRLRMLSRKELLDEVRAASKIPAHSGTLLTSRDIRKVDPFFAARLEPVIITRTGCITVSLGRTELRAIITRERLYFVVPDGADSILTLVQSNLAMLRKGDAVTVEPVRSQIPEEDAEDGAERGRSSSGANDMSSLPFELAALEALLLTACSELLKQQAQLTDRVNRALQALRRTVIGTRVVAGDKQLEQVRELKQEVRELLLQSQALERALLRVLDEDEDMEAMYLTRLYVTSSLPRSTSPGRARPPYPCLRNDGKVLQSPARRTRTAREPPGEDLVGAADGSDSDTPGSAGYDEVSHDEVETMIESYVQVRSDSVPQVPLGKRSCRQPLQLRLSPCVGGWLHAGRDGGAYIRYRVHREVCAVPLGFCSQPASQSGSAGDGRRLHSQPGLSDLRRAWTQTRSQWHVAQRNLH